MFLLSRSAIVLVGHFNPAIFQPQWFERYKILPIQDTQWAEGQKPKTTEIDDKHGHKIVIGEVPNFFMNPGQAELNFPTQRIHVDPIKFVCSTTKREHFSLIKETTTKTFMLLEHSPVRQLGNNFEAHWKFEKSSLSVLRNIFAKDSEAIRKALGKDFSVGGTIKFDKNDSKITMSFDASRSLEDGIFIKANFHREIKTAQASEAVNLLNENYDGDIADFINCAKNLLGDPIKTWEPQ